MKKILFITTALLTSAYSFSQSPAKTSIDKKVDAMVAKMTLEEKVGQMTQLTIDDVLDKKASSPDNWVIDTGKLNEAILKYHISSLLNVSGQATSRENWYRLISKIQQVAGQTRLKIPIIYGIDAMHGDNYTEGATLFPQEIGMAATFNPELALHEGEITAYETRASYIPWNFSPVLDLGRNPLWPRI
jgi:beta-glucosidase